jgi:hypothetical protein
MCRVITGWAAEGDGCSEAGMQVYGSIRGAKRVFGSWTIVDGMDGPDFCGWDGMILVFVWFEGLRDGMRSVLS